MVKLNDLLLWTFLVGVYFTAFTFAYFYSEVPGHIHCFAEQIKTPLTPE